MPNAFASLNVPATNGVAAGTSFANRLARTICVAGTFTGLVVIEGSADGVEWLALATFEGPDFQTLPLPIPNLRVRRKGIKPSQTPGTPVVTVGSEAVITEVEMLPPPATLNGAGAAVDVSGFFIQGLAVAGAFSNPGMVVHIEISQDGTCWAPMAPACTHPNVQGAAVAAQFARQRIAGRTVAGPVPTVGLFGLEVDICHEDLPLPALNGPGTAVNTSECGLQKTVIVGAPGGDVPCRIAVQGSNDNGTTWVTVMGWNTTGMRKLEAIFQLMRVDVSGLVAAVPGLCVGVGAPTGACEPAVEGESTTDVSIGGI